MRQSGYIEPSRFQLPPLSRISSGKSTGFASPPAFNRLLRAYSLLAPMRISFLFPPIAAILLSIAACRDITDPAVPARVALDRKALVGTWLLSTEQPSYSSATFRTDSQVVLGCLCDSIFI